jgi:hypothetical protein
MSLQQATVTETGDKVIPGTRRPDGTLRKERRVRAGYVPQEEQQVYKSVGAQVRSASEAFQWHQASRSWVFDWASCMAPCSAL